MSQYMFHPFDGGMGTSFERISDVPEFQNWLQEIKLELQGIYDRTHDTFVWETINLCGKRLDGFTEKKYFIELVGKLQAIRKNIDRYYPDEKRVRIVTLTRRCFWYEKETAYIYKSFFQE